MNENDTFNALKRLPYDDLRSTVNIKSNNFTGSRTEWFELVKKILIESGWQEFEYISYLNANGITDYFFASAEHRISYENRR